MPELKLEDLMYGQPIVSIETKPEPGEGITEYLDENYQVVKTETEVTSPNGMSYDFGDLQKVDAIEIDYNNPIDDRITPEMMLRTTTAISPLKSTASTDLNNLVPFVLIGFGIYLLLKD